MPRATPAPKSPVPRKSSTRSSAAEAADKNRPLVDDIRLLGRILGDVIREQEGQAAFDLVERTAGLGVAFQPVGHRQLAHPLDQFEGVLALLLADHVAEDSAQQADVVDQGTVLLGGIVGRIHSGHGGLGL